MAATIRVAIFHQASLARVSPGIVPTGSRAISFRLVDKNLVTTVLEL